MSHAKKHSSFVAKHSSFVAKQNLSITLTKVIRKKSLYFLLNTNFG